MDVEIVKEHVPTIQNIDANDFDDPSMVSEYVNDIYTYLREIELSTRVNPRYMTSQPDINEKMRSILVDWLADIHRMFKLLPETLFLSISIIDHYLQLVSVPRDKLQLVGVCSMLIASKYEEIYAPEVSDFIYISDSAYERDIILDTEQDILATLNFSLKFVSPLHFLRRFSKAADSDYYLHTLCKFIVEISLEETKFLKYLPSEIAMGAVFLARAMAHVVPIWNPVLAYYTGYSEIEARTVAIDQNNLLKKMQKSSLCAIMTKYSSKKFGEVAKIPLVTDL